MHLIQFITHLIAISHPFRQIVLSLLLLPPLSQRPFSTPHPTSHQSLPIPNPSLYSNCFFGKAFASSTLEAIPAQDATSCTSVPSVSPSTQCPSVASVGTVPDHLTTPPPNLRISKVAPFVTQSHSLSHPLPSPPLTLLDQPSTPINVHRFIQLLSGYSSPDLPLLVAGLRHGFRLDFDSPINTTTSTSSLPSTFNHQSALRNHPAVSRIISQELQQGILFGPFNTPPFPHFRISPLAAVQKKTPGEYRLIHNLSFPEGNSVNDLIEHSKGSCSYQTLDQVINHIVQLGSHSILTKFDIENAYKIIPVHPHDVPMLGFYWDGSFYFDRTLAMGCRTSAKIFEMFSTSLEWILHSQFHLPAVHHVLDDFLVISHPSSLAPMHKDIFLSVFRYLNIPLKLQKIDSGTTLTFLGVELDTVSMQARLPEEKLHKCRTQISSILSKKSVRQKDLASLVGLLNFTCKVVRPGRTFLRRLYDSLYSVKHDYHYIRITSDLREDLNLWLSFLTHYNGVSMFPPLQWTDNSTLHAFTDASKSGFGLILDNAWCFGEFDSYWSTFNICTLELYPIMLLFLMFGPRLSNTKITLHSDNMSVVEVLNSLTTKHKPTMLLLRHLVLASLQHNITFRALHIPGSVNKLADSLSRLQVDLFFTTAASMGHTVDDRPTPIPLPLRPERLTGF